MSKCKACGAEIKWIRTVTGKMMPVDTKQVSYRYDPQGTLTLLTMDGRVITKAVLDLNSDDFGYVSHFATCPAAKEFRRRNK